MALAILPYRDADRQATARLWLASWRSTGLAVAQLATEGVLLDRIARELAAGWDVHLAWDDGKLVGLLALRLASGCLDQLFIAPQAQGRGLGRVLLDFAKNRLPNGLWLRTAADNVRACRFYERNGLRRGEIRTHPTLGHQTVIYR
jgi:ribosomal protein S18 acetylase RimI-like enzyme